MNLSPLFEPFSLRSIRLANRFAMAPMQRHRPEDFIPKQEQAEDYRARVKGGIGLVVTQGTTMDHWTSVSPYARMFAPAYDGWRACVDAVREEGGHIFLQIWHEGANREGGYGPSGITVSGEERGKPLSKDAIRELIAAYAHTAQAAQRLGFSGVELHGAHGNLIDQFFYSGSNKREDEYGGDLEGRMRFGLEATCAVREAVGPDYPVGMRISQWKGSLFDCKPFTNPDELQAFLLPLKKAGIDIFHCSTRRFWTPEFEGSDLGYAAWVKQLSGLPVIAVGSVGLDSDMQSSYAGKDAHSTGVEGLGELARRFSRGDFDMIAVGRAVLTDPDYVNKIRDGKIEQLKKTLTIDEIRSSPAAKLS